MNDRKLLLDLRFDQHVDLFTYLCNKNQLDALFILSLFFVNQPLHVSGVSVAHHQEVYCIHTAIGTCCAVQVDC